MNSGAIIEPNFSARDAQLSAGPTVFRLFRQHFSTAFDRHVSKIIFEKIHE